MKKFFRTTITSSDRNVVSQFLLDAEKEMSECDAEMNRLRAKVLALESKKKGLKKVAEKCRSLLAPVHRLPTEILAHVFSMACKMNFDLCPLYPPSSMQLSSVCGRWREIVLSTTMLWSALRIDFSQWVGDFAALERAVRIFMDRSGVRPLQLELDFKGIVDDMADALRPIMGILARNCVRWQDVSLLRLDKYDAFLSHNSEGMAFSALRTLRMHSYDSLPPVARSLFKDSPALKSFEIGSQEAFEGEHFDLPWHQIETLTISLSDAPAALAFMSSFTHLKNLHLSRVGHDLSVTAADYNRHYSSNTMRSIEFTWDDQGDADTTLSRLTLPELSSLTMCNSGDGGPEEWPVWDESPAMDFLTRSACTITTLCLKELPMTDQQGIALLELMPFLATLEIEESSMTPHKIITQRLLQRLVVDHQEALLSGRSFLPLLTRLVLVVRKDGLVAQDFIDAVSSRWIPDREQAKEIGVDCMRSASISVMRGDASDVEKFSFLECFRDVGLQLTVNHTRTP
ncbi:hypothetical protein V5O48_006057 [Marasmius crinis-equi]|uniref:F-box domain-containing protein n=1 Tax=Marasmius crinis-equi TaxID=585013 RepID=A0ABR3FKS1_9AGAR